MNRLQLRRPGWEPLPDIIMTADTDWPALTINPSKAESPSFEDEPIVTESS